jgi:PleD family two-component response regulator
VASLTGTELGNMDNSERIIQQADDALLEAKKNGRNRIELYRTVLH